MPLLRRLFVAGIDRERYAAEWSACDYWLLNATTLWRATGELPEWLAPHVWGGKVVLWDPGTFAAEALSFMEYVTMLRQVIHPYHYALSYDVPGKPHLTLWYFERMLQIGGDPIPVIQPGIDPRGILKAWKDYGKGKHGRLAIGGILKYSTDEERFAYLDSIFYPDGPGSAPAWLDGVDVHLLGILDPVYYARYPAATGDSSSAIRRIAKREGTLADWLPRYGLVDLPFEGPGQMQARFGLSDSRAIMLETEVARRERQRQEAAESARERLQRRLTGSSPYYRSRAYRMAVGGHG